MMSGKQLNRLISRQEGYQQDGIFNEAGFQLAGGLSVLYHTEGSSLPTRAVGSPWHKFLLFPPAPYSRLTSKVDGNAAAPATGCVSHRSLEQRRNTKQCQTEPAFFSLSLLFLLKTPVTLLPPLTQLPLQRNDPPLGSFTPSLPPSSSFPRKTPGSGGFPIDAELLGSGVLSAALVSCRWELGEANNLGRRAPGAGAGVLAWPHPCQANKPRSAKVRARLDRIGKQGSPFAPVCTHCPRAGTQVMIWILAAAAARAGYCLPCARLCTFVLSQARKT